jgi:putative cardiolipin synthase
MARISERVTSVKARWLLPLALLLASGCSQLPERPDLPMELAAPVEQDSRLDAFFGAAEARHPGDSGFRLLQEGTEAFVLRAETARRAARSLDVQTYIWHADMTGRFLAHAVLEAADRGVRVRLLLDDMDARAKN